MTWPWKPPPPTFHQHPDQVPPPPVFSEFRDAPPPPASAEFRNVPPPPVFTSFRNTPTPPNFNNTPSYPLAPMYYPPTHIQQVPYMRYNSVQQENTMMPTTPAVHRGAEGHGNGPRKQRGKKGGRADGRANNRRNSSKKGIAGDGNARDLAVSKAVLSRFGVKMPQGKEDIEKWIAERKRNWPSKRNVERKLKEREEKDRLQREKKEEEKQEKEREKYGESLAQIANIYGSSAEEGEVREDKEKESKKRIRTEMDKDAVGEDERDGRDGEVGPVRGETKDKAGLTGKGRQNHKRRNKKRKRGNGRNRGGEGVGNDGMAASKMSLMRKLLDDEIQKEAGILFQAFHYLAERDRALTLVDGGEKK